MEATTQLCNIFVEKPRSPRGILSYLLSQPQVEIIDEALDLRVSHGKGSNSPAGFRKGGRKLPDGGGDPARRKGSKLKRSTSKQTKARAGGLVRHLPGTGESGLALGSKDNREGAGLSARRSAGCSGVRASRGARPVRCDASAECTPRARASRRAGLQVPASPEAARGGVWRNSPGSGALGSAAEDAAAAGGRRARAGAGPTWARALRAREGAGRAAAGGARSGLRGWQGAHSSVPARRTAQGS